MVSAVIGAFFFGAFAILMIAAKLYRRVYQFSDPTIPEVIPFLIEVKRGQLQELLDSGAERCLRANLDETEFRKAQQKRIRLMLRLLAQMDQNARALLALGQRDRERGWKAGDPQWRDLGEDLVNTSLNFRGGAVSIQLALHQRLISSVLFPFVRAGSLAQIVRFDGFELFPAYQRMIDAALNLGQAYGADMRERLASAL